MKNPFRRLKYQEERFWKHARTRSKRCQIILTRAFELSKTAHKDQRRYEGDHYFIHPLRTANSLIYEFRVRNCAMIASALLHDVVEDTDVGQKTIEQEFGEEIARLVKNLTRPRLKDENEIATRISKGRKYCAIMRADKKTRTVKCADMLDNMRCWYDLFVLYPKYPKIARWFGEANRYYLPLAHKTDRFIEKQMDLALARATHCLRP